MRPVSTFTWAYHQGHDVEHDATMDAFWQALIQAFGPFRHDDLSDGYVGVLASGEVAVRFWEPLHPHPVKSDTHIYDRGHYYALTPAADLWVQLNLPSNLRRLDDNYALPWEVQCRI